MPSPYPIPFWSSLLVHVGLFQFTMVAPVCIPTHRYLLAGVAQLDSQLTRFSSRFPRLMTSHTQGDDAFPVHAGLGITPNVEQSVVKVLLANSALRRSSPGS